MLAPFSGLDPKEQDWSAEKSCGADLGEAPGVFLLVFFGGLRLVWQRGENKHFIFFLLGFGLSKDVFCFISLRSLGTVFNTSNMKNFGLGPRVAT